jgi:chitinase
MNYEEVLISKFGMTSIEYDQYISEYNSYIDFINNQYEQDYSEKLYESESNQYEMSQSQGLPIL